MQIMKQLALLTLALGAVVSSSVTFAQSDSGPLTRAQVRADLIRIEQAGYRPAANNDPYYPADIQAAEARVAAQDATHNDWQMAAESVGGMPQDGSSQAGKPIEETPARSIYFGK
jgi:Domain of unknown function (DUF4148)